MNPFTYIGGILLYALPRWLASKFPSKYERERQERMDREDSESEKLWREKYEETKK